MIESTIQMTIPNTLPQSIDSEKSRWHATLYYRRLLYCSLPCLIAHSTNFFWFDNNDTKAVIDLTTPPRNIRNTLIQSPATIDDAAAAATTTTVAIPILPLDDTRNDSPTTDPPCRRNSMSSCQKSPRQTGKKKTPRKPTRQPVAKKQTRTVVKKGRAKQVRHGKHQTRASAPRSSSQRSSTRENDTVRSSSNKRFARRTRSTVVTENTGVMYARTMCAYQFQFVPGSVTNFWECPCCAHFTLRQKPKHSVIFSLDPEAPNKNSHKQVNLHFEQCWQHESHVLSDFSGASSTSNSNDESEEEFDDSSDSTCSTTGKDK